MAKGYWNEIRLIKQANDKTITYFNFQIDLKDEVSIYFSNLCKESPIYYFFFFRDMLSLWFSFNLISLCNIPLKSDLTWSSLNLRFVIC